ncbi:hypothetical protein [Paenibacillus sp. sgz500958]|uniref:hypothetical protein n=1 Tax=Paenibacillus sp. sgz500958 TaxID=3242475 RepID=UPI0036D2C8EB
MDVHSDSYTIAPLNGKNEAVEIIRDAEAAIARLTGNNSLTLIAYEKSTGADSTE